MYPKNFSRKELVRSETALRQNINNEPFSAEHELNLLELANFLQWLRDGLSREHQREVIITVSSGYRSEALNTLVGGSKTSAHSYGYAADIRASGLNTALIVDFIYEHQSEVEFDQVIDEFSAWVHIGIEQPKTGKRRKQFLNARKVSGRTVYTSSPDHPQV